LKKIIAGSAAGMLAVSSVAASAAPVAFETAQRNASPILGAEALGDEISEVWLVFLFAAIAAGIILAVDSSGNDIEDLPASP